MNFDDILKTLKIFKKVLKYKGKIYLELPSTDAVEEGYKRQEFFQNTLMFSQKSAFIFFSKQGFNIDKLISIKEIGNKYTLRIILSKSL